MKKYDWGSGEFSSDQYLNRLAQSGLSIIPRNEAATESLLGKAFERPNFALAHSKDNAKLFYAQCPLCTRSPCAQKRIPIISKARI